MDRHGRLWTPMDMKAFRFGLCGRLWTPVDTAWRSTDQGLGFKSLRVYERNPCVSKAILLLMQQADEAQQAAGFLGGFHGRF